VVRVYKEGFEPFETRVEVAGGGTVNVVARLRVLAAAGRLRVAEQGGKALGVVIDGNEVGKTPWEGPLSTGEHTVLLQGEGALGTQPVSVPVKRGERTPLMLVAEDLAASLQVEPTPRGASVAIDGISVGRGVWSGRLRAGAHWIEVSAAGFVAKRQAVSLARGEQGQVAVELLRDLSSPVWRRPSRFMIEAAGAVALAPSLGGDVANRCSGPCQKGLGAGGYGVLHLGYELGIGFGFGLSAGYVQMSQATTNRSLSFQIMDTSPSDAGTVADSLTVRGFLAGAWAGYSGGERLRVHVRLGAGGVFGSVSDTRTGSFVSGAGLQNDLGPITVRPSASFVYVAPELRGGLRFGDHFEVTAGLGVLLLFGLEKPVWTNPPEGYYATIPQPPGNPPRGYFGTFPAESLTGRVLLSLLPGVGARYDF
jgi:opacity protein-like surface antigen